MGKKIKPQIHWEDSESNNQDPSLEADETDAVQQNEFEAMLKDSPTEETVSVRVGDKVIGTIQSIGTGNNQDIIIEIGQKLSGYLPKKEIEGSTEQFNVGDKITCFVVSKDKDGIQLSTNQTAAVKNEESLILAAQEKMPIFGNVVGENKGGFEVKICGKIAFCPVSQMDIKFVKDKAAYIGQELEFIIETYRSNGREFRVSRQALLRKRARERLEKIKRGIGSNKTYEGTVTDIRPFGVFVDIGGVEGLVHVSELSFTHINNPSDQFQVGDLTQVKVLKIDEGSDSEQPKISLSIKAAQKDPWDEITKKIQSQETYQAKVVRLAKFGAFCELLPGIEGLIHLSEMSWEKKIYAPSEVLKVDDIVSVRILEMNPIEKRISLSMKSIEDDPWYELEQKFPVAKPFEATVARLAPFGAIVSLKPGVTGLLPLPRIKAKFGDSFRKHCSPPQTISVEVESYDRAQKKVLLSIPGIKKEEDLPREYVDPATKKSQDDKPNSTVTLGSLGEKLKEKFERKKM